MDITVQNSDEIPSWAYYVAGGVAAGVAVLGTTLVAWRHRKAKKARDAALNNKFHKDEVDGMLESLRAATPREET